MRFRGVVTFGGLLALVACHPGATGTTGPEPLKPLAGTGQVAIDMNGSWRVAEVVVLTEAPNATEPLAGPGGFAPPVEGEALVIANDHVVAAESRDLTRAGAPYPDIQVFRESLDGQLLSYYRRCDSPSIPGRMDSGAAETLQFVFGTTDADTMVGLVQYSFATAFPPRDRPTGGLYQVTLRRDGVDDDRSR